MQCYICSRSESSNLSFCCTTCARNSLYELRLKKAQTLLQKENIGHQVQAAIAGTSSWTATAKVVRGQNSDTQHHQRTDHCTFEQLSDRGIKSRERAQEILGHIDCIQKEIEAGKADIARRRAFLTQRHSAVASATRGLGERRAVVLASLGKGTMKTDKNWNAMHKEIVNARVFLCKEAASLYGLRQRRRKRGGTIKDEYTLGGIAIADLRDLNSISPAQITVSMERVTHLLVLTSHYLSLRLPAEITLPHRNYPLPTIFSPGSSYSSRQVSFPGCPPLHPSPTSPSASRNGDIQPSPRPRPLYLDKKLPLLAKEDPVAYSLFVEGVTLLAWNVAWLCRTQGLHVGTSSWEDVCTIGKNLWQLLVVLPRPGPISRVSSSNDTAAKPTEVKGPCSPSVPGKESISRLSLGEYSHGSARAFLGGARGTELMQGWKLQSPVKIIDRVKSMLLGELAGAEWEILDGKEFEQESGRPEDEEVVLLRGRRREAGRTLDVTKSTVTSTLLVKDEQALGDNEDSGGMGKGTSGWTKLKSRGA
ncbi:MAG: hypothetical protein M1830_004556 [Pleopsidium flavum]|nr:MAG: hypothetical protein M1830_004556 [Pleopsidium flavum]